jgi:hypothetical protein
MLPRPPSSISPGIEKADGEVTGDGRAVLRSCRKLRMPESSSVARRLACHAETQGGHRMSHALIKLVALAGITLVAACRQEGGVADGHTTTTATESGPLPRRAGETLLEDPSRGLVDVPPSANSDAAKGADDAAGVTIEVARTEDASAAPHVLHSDCRSRDPHSPSATSPDGRITVFVSTDSTRRDDSPLGEGDHQDLCIKRQGEPPTLLLAGNSENDPEGSLTAFNNFLFSPDGTTLYFASAAWPTNNAAHAVDLATGKERFVTSGTIAAVITTGPYRGNLVSMYDGFEDGPEGAKLGRITKYFVVTPFDVTVRRLPAGCTDSRQCDPDAVCIKAKGATRGACLPIR